MQALALLSQLFLTGRVAAWLGVRFLMAAVPLHHPLAACASVSVARLAQAPFLLYPCLLYTSRCV